jgi:hypothetical protein
MALDRNNPFQTSTSNLYQDPILKLEESKMSEIKRLVLDVLKPHHPSIIDLATRLSVVEGVSGVNCTLDEVDQETESIKITIEGTAINYEDVEEVIIDSGAVIHSVDSVSAGKKLVEEVETPQDR